MIVKNKSGSEIYLSSLGFTIPDDGVQDLFSEGNEPFEVYGNIQVRELISTGDLVACRYDSTLEDFVELDSDESLSLWDGNGFRLPRYVEKYSDLADIPSPYENLPAYVQDLDSTFVYKSGQWEQCGEEVILREGLASGKLFVNNVKVG